MVRENATFHDIETEKVFEVCDHLCDVYNDFVTVDIISNSNCD